MPQPPSVEQLAAELLNFTTAAQARLDAEQQDIADNWLTWPRPRRLARLRELQAAVTAIAGQADTLALAFAYQQLPQAYATGAADSGMAPTAWTQVDLNAISVLAQQSHAELLTATRFMRRSTKELINTLSREFIATRLLTGETAVATGRQLARAMADHSITAIVYKDGSRHGLDDYADVVARSQTALAYNAGNLNQYAANDVTHVEVFDGPECGWTFHDDPDRADGSVRTLDESYQYPTSHPRCQRAFAAVDVTVSDAATSLLDDAAAAEPQLTDLVSGLAEDNGGTMAGLDYRLKGKTSLVRKIRDEVRVDGVNPEMAASEIFDANRYTTVFPEDGYATAAQTEIDALRARGYDVEVKNYWAINDNPYQGINAKIRGPDGQRFELQFHTATSLEVKEGALHTLYAEQRKLDVTLAEDQRLIAELDRQMFEASAQIPVPAGAASVR